MVVFHSLARNGRQNSPQFFGGAWRSVASIEGRHQLPGLVQVATSVVAEHDAELAFEPRLHGQVEAELTTIAQWSVMAPARGLIAFVASSLGKAPHHLIAPKVFQARTVGNAVPAARPPTTATLRH